MKNFLLIFSIILYFPSYSQFFEKDSLFNKFSIGFNTSATVYDDTKEDSNDFADFIIEPYFRYYFYKNIGVGIIYSQELFFTKGNYNKTPTNELGLTLNYMLPYSVSKGFFSRFYIAIGAEFRKTNCVKYSETIDTVENGFNNILVDYKMSNKMNKNLIAFPVSIQLRTFRNLFLVCDLRLNIYIEGDPVFGGNLGIQYNFKERKRH